MADRMDTVLDALHDAANALTDNAFELKPGEMQSLTLSFDLRPCIFELCTDGLPGILTLTLSAGSKANVKPELVWEELMKMSGLPAETKPLAIRRMDLLTGDGISLGEV